MPRNMSFMLTTEQIRNQKKTVTRRLGWKFLRHGDIVNACEKCQGLKKGEKIKKICQIRIVDIVNLPLFMMWKSDCIKEGFPELEPKEFIKMFCKEMGCKPDTLVNRIEFEYV